MEKETKPIGVILCGGESSRMGLDKSSINYHGNSQRVHLSKLISEFCSPVIYSIASELIEDEAEFSDLPEYRGNGPVSGLLSLHQYFPRRDILLLGCDYPLITKSQLGNLVLQYEKGLDAVCYIGSTSNNPEPLLAYYSADFCEKIKTSFENTGASSLRKYLEEGNLKKLIIDNPIHLISADRPEDASRVREIILKGFDTFV